MCVTDTHVYWLVVIINLKRVTWEEVVSAEELPLSDWPIDMSMRHFLDCQLIHNNEGPVQYGWRYPWAGGQTC